MIKNKLRQNDTGSPKKTGVKTSGWSGQAECGSAQPALEEILMLESPGTFGHRQSRRDAAKLDGPSRALWANAAFSG